MTKTYKVYSLKHGLMKYELEFTNFIAPSNYHKNEVSLALSEAILNSQGYNRIGEVTEKVPMVIEAIEDDSEEKDEE